MELLRLGFLLGFAVWLSGFLGTGLARLGVGGRGFGGCNDCNACTTASCGRPREFKCTDG